jgi:hypothetical protein
MYIYMKNCVYINFYAMFGELVYRGKPYRQKLHDRSLCIWGGITVLILFLIEAELMMQHGA